MVVGGTLVRTGPLAATPKAKEGGAVVVGLLLLMGVTVLDTTMVGAMPKVEVPAAGAAAEGALETADGAGAVAAAAVVVAVVGNPPKL